MVDTDETVLFATTNSGKRREFESLLGNFLNPKWRTFDLNDWPQAIPEIVEDRDTFRGNAIKKAMEASEATGCVAISDDSGLEVDALDGRPGVYSARFAGENASDEENNKKLVAELQGVPDEDRTARYVAVIALAIPNNPIGRAIVSRTGMHFEDVAHTEPTKEGEMVRLDDRIVVWFRGTVEGRIIDDARGSGGFGYDPHFYVPQWDKTMAEVPLERKNSISHRAEALDKVEAFFTGNP